MEEIRLALEKALNSTHLMRGIKRGWLYAGSFTMGELTYSFYGSPEEQKVTCRCMNADNYANHYFDMFTEYTEIDGSKIISVVQA